MILRLLLRNRKLDAEAEALAATLKKWTAIYSGTGCETIRFNTEGSMGVSYVVGVTDAEQALALYRNMAEDLAPFLKSE